jgi:carboxylate-amine ligase
MTKDSGFTIGIEEEYMLVDPDTRDLVADAPPAVIETCASLIPKEVGAATAEFLRAQIEVDTSVCRSIAECREKLSMLRACASEAATKYGYRIIAASTHPFAAWAEQRHTDKQRYNVLARDLQEVAHRMLICGMHVHVGCEDDELRIDLLNQLGYFLPHLLALSTSSPFWQGRKTGLKSYRVSVFDELPRTGLPERFASFGEYQRHVDTMVRAGLIEDATKIWWDVRPSARFPTLEMRSSDICTRLEDGISIAALYICIVSMLQRLRKNNQRWRIYSNMLIQENRWRAQRYGVDEGLVDFGRGEIVAYSELLLELLDIVAEDAEILGCVEELEHTKTILERGTSAHRQTAVYDAAVADGASEQEALHRVVDWLIEETVADVSLPGSGKTRKRSESGPKPKRT